MSSTTMSGFATWYVEWVLILFVLGLGLYEMWCWGVRHGRQLESDEQLTSFDAFMNDATLELNEELEAIYNRPTLFDQDVD